MKKLLFALPLLITFLFVSCEQEEDMLSLSSSADADVQPFETQANAKGFIGRIAYSTDGNDHDRDDIGATPMGLAILAHFGLQNKLVHYDYNSHIWGNGPRNQKKDMTESTLGAAQRFDFNKSVFISAIDEQNKAEKSIADAINNSSASNPLYLVVGGPMAVACEGIRRSDSEKRKFVTVISHSSWNNEHQHNGSCTADGIKQTGVKFVQIKDQNAGLRGDWKNWDWMEKHSNGNLRWVYDRMKTALYPRADVSDAGMLWYLLTNDENSNANKLKSFFAKGAPSVDPDPKDNEDDKGKDNDKDNDNDKGGNDPAPAPPPGSGSNGDICYASGNNLGQAIKNLEDACGVKYNKSKGHDCDPDGNGGWICATGDVEDMEQPSGRGKSPDTPPSTPSGNNGDCQASGNNLGQAIKNLEDACGVKYNKSKGHDCDPDGKGGWICATSEI